MFEFAGGIPFRVDVGDFLQLQRTFECNRKQRTAPEKQRMAPVHELFSELGGTEIEAQRIVDDGGESMQRRDQLCLAFGRETMAPCEQDRQQTQVDQLRRKRFRRATPISAPASSINARSDSRTSELVATLQIVNVAA